MRVSTLVPASTLALASLASATLPRLGGYNLAGLDFGMTTWGWSGTPQAPPIGQIAHFAALGANLVRIPFGWQYMTPELGGALDDKFFKTYDDLVNAALAATTGTYVILDLHNYARWSSDVVGSSDGPTAKQFASLWGQLAGKYAAEPRVIFGLMNEPHDLSDFGPFVGSLQEAVNAIREAGANTQHILLPGNDWTHVKTMVESSGPALVGGVKDPAGGEDKLVIDVHAYLDADGSGGRNECVTNNVALLQTLVDWLKINGRQAILSETGGINSDKCAQLLGEELAYIVENKDTIAGFAAWSAGSFDTNYELSITPLADGSDNALVKKAIAPNFPSQSALSNPIVVSTSASASASVAPSASASTVAPSSAPIVMSSAVPSSSPLGFPLVPAASGTSTDSASVAATPEESGTPVDQIPTASESPATEEPTDNDSDVDATTVNSTLVDVTPSDSDSGDADNDAEPSKGSDDSTTTEDASNGSATSTEDGAADVDAASEPSTSKDADAFPTADAPPAFIVAAPQPTATMGFNKVSNEVLARRTQFQAAARRHRRRAASRRA